MIRDLSGTGDLAREADVLVVGAGTAGLAMAVRLAQAGRRVVCLESGGREQVDETHPLNATEQTGTRYAGADHGRFRCLGGTSTRWGGALIPFQRDDTERAGWPIRAEELARWVDPVERLFGLTPGPYEEPAVFGGGDYLARLAKWPPFRNRNVFNLLEKQATATDGPEIWLHATACEFGIEDGALRRVVARAPDGSRLEVRARTVVLAAGAIETTRLLLLADRQNGGVVDGGHGLLGRHFHDHLSTVVADLSVRDRKAMNRIAGFRFEAGGAMRNVRFELAPGSPLRESIPPCFAHIAFDDTSGGGFDALRDVFRQLQRRRLPGPATLARLAAGAPWLTRAVWWRFAEKRLLYPAGAGLELHMVIEQEPAAQNRIALSDAQVDAYGQPLARIDWDVRAADVSAMQRATDRFEAAWNASRLAPLARIARRDEAAVEAAMRAGGGIYHPGGSTRMGTSAADGVVDADLRLFAAPNVRVVSTSVLPTGGGGNPTMTLMMLALRCVDQLGAEGAR